MKSFIEGLVELAYFALLYDHLVASVMKLAISVIESAFSITFRFGDTFSCFGDDIRQFR